MRDKYSGQHFKQNIFRIQIHPILVLFKIMKTIHVSFCFVMEDRLLYPFTEGRFIQKRKEMEVNFFSKTLLFLQQFFNPIGIWNLRSASRNFFIKDPCTNKGKLRTSHETTRYNREKEIQSHYINTHRDLCKGKSILTYCHSS